MKQKNNFFTSALSSCDYTSGNGGCYKVFNSTESWFRARFHCQEMDADLAFISKDIAMAMRDANALTSEVFYWMGLHGSEWLLDSGTFSFNI